jgi:RimJ/RimL family protein N-acetyltransferase
VSHNFETVMTRRLALRIRETADADDLFAISADPQTWKHAPSGHHTAIQTTLDWIVRARELWVRDGLSYWLVRLLNTDEMLGAGGVQRQKGGNWNLNFRFAGIHRPLCRPSVSRPVTAQSRPNSSLRSR